jgi:hypothetical protein
MAGRRRTKVLAAAWRRRGWRRHRYAWPDAAEALTMLVRAWATTVFASALLLTALAVARVWDGGVFRHALRDSLHLDPQFEQPTDDNAGAASVGSDNSSPRAILRERFAAGEAP